MLHLKRCLEVAGGEKEVVSAEFISAVWGDEYGDELCVGLVARERGWRGNESL